MRVAFAIACAFVFGCAQTEQPQQRAADVPVFILSIDSVRADRLPVYGYSRGSTPAIDAFRRDAILFQWAFSHAPLTLPSHASILTGELPAAHGIRGDVGYRLSPDAGTLATTLKQMGYATGAAVSSYTLRGETGISQGFDFYDDRVGVASRPTLAERDGDETRKALTDWLVSSTGRRVFGFLHLNEPNAPHVAPGGVRRGADEYDSEIARADEIFGRFLDSLRERKLYDDALIILLSDHGEGLGDHGEDEHGLFLYRESIHVPLLVKLPRGERRGETVARVQGLDRIREAVLAVVRGHRNAALLRKARVNPPVYAETYYPRIHFGWQELRALITDSRHVIDSRKPELYDYRSDPAETKNLEKSEPSVLRDLVSEARMKDAGFRPPTADDTEVLIRALPARPEPAPDAPEPKDKVQIVRDLQRAVRFYEAGRYRDAIPLLERVVFYEPAIVHGWAMLGRSRAAAGQRDLALEAYGEGIERFPKSAELALLAAHEHADAQNWQNAERLARSVTEGDPVLANEALAEFAMRRGNAAAARSHAEVVVRHAPGRIAALLTLAEVSRLESRPADHLMWLDRAANELRARGEPPPRGLEAGRGAALATLGRRADAEAAYRAEVARYADNVEAWRGLSVLVSAMRGRDAARDVLVSAIRAHDTETMRTMAREALSSIGDSAGMTYVESQTANTRT